MFELRLLTPQQLRMLAVAFQNMARREYQWWDHAQAMLCAPSQLWGENAPRAGNLPLVQGTWRRYFPGQLCPFQQSYIQRPSYTARRLRGCRRRWFKR